MKKILIIALAALMMISLMACAPAKTDASMTSNAASSPETEQTAKPQASEAPITDETLESLVAARNPENMLTELTMYLELTTLQFEKTTDAIKAAGLEDEETYQTLLDNWDELIYVTVTSFLVDMSDLGQTDEEISADELFQSSMRLYMGMLSDAYTQMGKVIADPAGYLARWNAGSDLEKQETDGSWPTGYDFDHIVPPLDAYDSFYTDDQGAETFGIEGGMELYFAVNKMDRAAAETYVKKAKDAGFTELGMIEEGGIFMWMGDMGNPYPGDAVPDEYLFVLVGYAETAAGTDEDPQFTLSLMNWDYMSNMGITL